MLRTFCANDQSWAKVYRVSRPQKLSKDDFLKGAAGFAADGDLFNSLCRAFLESHGVPKQGSLNEQFQAAAEVAGLDGDALEIAKALVDGRVPEVQTSASAVEENLPQSILVKAMEGGAAAADSSSRRRNPEPKRAAPEPRVLEPKVLEWSDPEDDAEVAAGAVLRFQRVLVEFIQRQLREMYGDAWLRRGCGKLIDKMKKENPPRIGRNRAKLPKTELGLAHLSELGWIMTLKENWPAFQAFYANDIGMVNRAFDSINALRVEADHASQRTIYLMEELEALTSMIRVVKPFHPGTAEFINEFLEQRRSEPPIVEEDPAEGSTPRVRPRTVQDRMSEAAPPARTARSRPHEEILGPDERYVLEHPVSDAKVTALVESIRSHLDRSMPTFRLFEIVGARTPRDVYDPAFRFALDLLSFKGPFVEGSAWAEVRQYEFALRIERFLLRQFAELIAERGKSADALPRQAEDIKAFLRASAAEIRNKGGSADLVVILEPGGDDVQRLFIYERGVYARGWWDTPRTLRGTPVQDVVFLKGQIDGLPVLQIREASVDRALVCVLDLEDYELVLMNASEDKSDFLDLTVDPLSLEDAERRVRESPSIRESMYEGEHHEAGSYTFEEAVLRMQLMANYRILAAGEVGERHRPRTISAWLAACR